MLHINDSPNECILGLKIEAFKFFFLKRNNTILSTPSPCTNRSILEALLASVPIFVLIVY